MGRIKMVARAPGTWVWVPTSILVADEPVHERLCEIPVAELWRTNENEWDGYRFKIKYFVPITICGAVS